MTLALYPTVSTPAQSMPGENDGQYYTVKVWGADEGLSEGSVTDVAQTPEGYLWVGTLFGSVLRFDGLRFVSYNSANTPEFLLKWGVPRLMVDKTGTLWISMHDGGLTTWDKDGFHSAVPKIDQPDRLLWSAPGRVIFGHAGGQILSGRENGEQWEWETVLPDGASGESQACADADGRIWYLRGYGQVAVWDGKTSRSIAAPAAIRVLTADGQGHIWAGTDRALLRWQTDHFDDMTPTNGEPVFDIRRLVPSGMTNLWVEADGTMRRCSGRQWVAASERWPRELGKVTNFRFLHGDAEGGLWAAAGDRGLIHVLPDGTFHRLTTRDGLPSNTIRFAYQDRDGNTWTGYERGGLVRVRRRIFRVVGRDQGLADSLVNTVSEDPQGGIWIGMHNGAVGHFENGVCTNIILPGAIPPQDSCVAVDAEGRVWIGAQGVGLVEYEGQGRLRTVATMEQLQAYPRLLLPAHDGKIWVGTIWNLFCVSNNSIHAEYTAKTVGEHPTALVEAPNGTIWAGTLDGHLLRRDGNHFTTLEPPDHGALGRIWALWPAPDGTLWAGTEVGGLLHWTKGTFHRFTVKDGLPSDSVVQVLGDAGGNIWMGTRAGLVRMLGAALAKHEKGELSQIQASVYGTADGLLTIGSAIIFQPNCWRAPDDTLFFAMANSVASVAPDAVHINTVAPTITLEELQADGERVFPSRTGAILAASPGAPPSIKISPGRGDLEFRYTGVSLASPLRVRFKYKLDGLENAWVDAGSERKATYRRVPPGDYVFRVIACNSDGICSEGGGLLAVTVEPYVYQTAWFQVGCALVLVLGLLLAVISTMRRRLRRRLQESQRQQELERERARIAQDLHDDLGAGLTEIGLLSGMLRGPTRAGGREKEALERIAERCHGLVTALDEIVWAVNPRNDSINSLGNYLCRYAQAFLEATPIRCRLEMTEAEPDRPLNSEQRHNFFLACEEALTNIVKHSNASEARICISCGADGRLVIQIEDDGRSLPASVREGSNGLTNLKQRMSRIGGECDISNGPKKGVTVKLSLQL